MADLATLHDLPWADRPEEHLGSPTVSIFDCYGQRVAVGLRQVDAEAIVERMNALIEEPAPKPGLRVVGAQETGVG